MLIDGWKNRGLTPEQVPAGEAAVFANGKGLKLYKAYQERLKILNAADFGDLLLECIRLFREQPDVLRQYQGRFKFILVDEYQDTNVAQYLWLRLLAQRSSSSAATGTNAENTSPRARGEVERSEGEGASQLPERADTPPHPIPLPASGARECERQPWRHLNQAQHNPKTSAASATTISRFTVGAAPRSTTSCASSTTFPAPS